MSLDQAIAGQNWVSKADLDDYAIADTKIYKTDEKDALSEPVCRKFETEPDEPDLEPIEDHCCRIYSNFSFRGRVWWFCSDQTGSSWTQYDLNDLRTGFDQLMAIWGSDEWGKNWHSEISSYRTGKKARCRLCYNDECDQYEEIGVNGWNAKVGHNDSATWVHVQTVDGDPGYIDADLFDQRDCIGNSRFITMDAQSRSSGMKYVDPQKWKWAEGTAISVHLRPNQIFTAFENNGSKIPFETDQATVRHAGCYNFADHFGQNNLKLQKFASLQLRENPKRL